MYQSPYAKIKPKTKKPYTEIFLIRHCHPDYNKAKVLGEANMPLSKHGIRQRTYLTKKLVSLEIDKDYSSELKRAQESAALYIKKVNRQLFIDARLNEINWAHWVRVKYFNTTEESRKKKMANHKEVDRQLDRMQTIARRTLADIYRKNKGKKIALFSHGNFIRALITGILNADVIGFLSLEIFQSSISKLVIDRDGYVKISYINDISHLPAPPHEDLFSTLVD